MVGPDLVASVAALLAADLASCDRGALAELVSVSQRVRGWLDAFDGDLAARASQLDEPAASLLAGGGRRSTRDAESVARRGAVGVLLPGLRDALAAGEVSAGHADAVARISGELDDAGRDELAALEADLVGSARSSSVEAFEREVRRLGRVLSRDDGVGQHERLRRQRSLKRWQDRQTGLCHTHITLDPEADARLAATLDAAVAAEQASPEPDDRTLEQLKADVIVELITGARTSDHRVPEVSVLIDYDTLLRGPHDHTVAETSDGIAVPAAVIRRLCCEAEIIPIVLDGDGVTLDVGRQRRVATREQRRALRAMYRTCGHPDCQVRFADCDIHHVTAWYPHGDTDLDNLLPLCNRHHHLVHEGGWTLTLSADRVTTWRRPGGTIAHTGSTVDVAPAGVARAPADVAAADEPRPGESEIPLHVRRAARPAPSVPAPPPHPAPAPGSARSTPTTVDQHHADPDPAVVAAADVPRPGESEIPLHVRRAARPAPSVPAPPSHPAPAPHPARGSAAAPPSTVDQHHAEPAPATTPTVDPPEPEPASGLLDEATRDAILVALARARARALGPPSRAPAA